MKQLAMCALAGLLMAGCQPASEGYVIKGTVEDAQDGKVYLQSFRNKMFFNVDSADIVDGRFTFKGQVDQPLLYGLITDQMGSPLQFFLENVELNVSIGDDGEKIEVENSPINNLYLDNMDKIFAAPSYDIDSLVAKYPSSPVTAFLLYRYFTYQLPLQELIETRNRLSASLDDCPYVKDLDAIIKQLEKVQIGQIAPDFSLPDTAGVNVSLSAFRGKYVLVDFWASWCPPCRRENPNVVKAYQDYKDKNFTVIGVSLDENKDKWKRAIAEDGLTWTHVSDLKFWDSEIPALYGVRGIPANILLDPDGVIIARNIKGEELQAKLTEVLK